jgi:hypothetical protein
MMFIVAMQPWLLGCLDITCGLQGLYIPEGWGAEGLGPGADGVPINHKHGNRNLIIIYIYIYICSHMQVADLRA